VKGLTQKIRQVLKDEKLRKSLAEGARRYVTEHSWANVAQHHIKLYEEVLAEKKVK